MRCRRSCPAFALPQAPVVAAAAAAAAATVALPGGAAVPSAPAPRPAPAHEPRSKRACLIRSALARSCSRFAAESDNVPPGLLCAAATGEDVATAAEAWVENGGEEEGESDDKKFAGAGEDRSRMRLSMSAVSRRARGVVIMVFRGQTSQLVVESIRTRTANFTSSATERRPSTR